MFRIRVKQKWLLHLIVTKGSIEHVHMANSDTYAMLPNN